ncbi:MAG: hypothetical protein JSV49_04750 [Thermoplasmata archaeon]|nr:MAG: hypothetical protein JSV49_04750 [Thermoplasmata archaeon]
MAYDPSAPAKKTADQIGHQVVDLTQRDTFFSQLQQQGYNMIGNPIQFPGSSDPNTLRYWAKEYAVTVNGDFVVEVNDPNYSQEPSNTLVFFIWAKQSPYQQTPGTVQAGTAAAPQAAATVPQAGAPAAPAYANPIAVVEQLLWRLANILAEPTPRFNFQDTGELLHPFVTIREHAYEHLGGRIMNLYMVKDGIYDYKILGNEAHGQAGGRLTPMRDEVFSMKTLGTPSFFIMDEFKMLESTQQNQIIYALQTFLSQC